MSLSDVGIARNGSCSVPSSRSVLVAWHRIMVGDQGAPSGTRTPNPLVKSQLLCQLS
jgi:hypothetical protein